MTFDEVWFGKNPNYQEGKVTILQVRGVAELDGEILDDEKTVFYGLGDGWEAQDGGASVSHGSGKTQFNENSGMGRLIRSVVNIGEEVLDEIADRGETYEAETWQGLRFAMERKTFKFTDRTTKEEREYSVELPVAFLGVDEGDAPAKKASSSRRSSAKASETKAASGGRRRSSKAAAEEEAPAEEAKPAGRRRSGGKAKANPLRDAVVAFAAEWEEHSEFMEAVLDPDEFDQAEEVQNDEELLNDILDADGSVWTASREIEPA